MWLAKSEESLRRFIDCDAMNPHLHQVATGQACSPLRLSPTRPTIHTGTFSLTPNLTMTPTLLYAFPRNRWDRSSWQCRLGIQPCC